MLKSVVSVNPPRYMPTVTRNGVINPTPPLSAKGDRKPTDLSAISGRMVTISHRSLGSCENLSIADFFTLLPEKAAQDQSISRLPTPFYQGRHQFLARMASPLSAQAWSEKFPCDSIAGGISQGSSAAFYHHWILCGATRPP